MEGGQGSDPVNKAREGKSRKERAFWAYTVERIMQDALPTNPCATIHRDATDLVDEWLKDFMGILAMEAHEQRRKEGKDKMSALHVIKASYDNYVGPVTEHLQRYREDKGYAGHGKKRATAPWQMTPQPSDSALGPPPAGITVQGQLPAAAATTATGEMEAAPLRLFGFALDQPPHRSVSAVRRPEMRSQAALACHLPVVTSELAYPCSSY